MFLEFSDNWYRIDLEEKGILLRNAFLEYHKDLLMVFNAISDSSVYSNDTYDDVFSIYIRTSNVDLLKEIAKRKHITKYNMTNEVLESLFWDAGVKVGHDCI